MEYPLGRIFIIPAYKLWLRKIDGIENIPRSKPFIIAANHSSYYDTILPHCIIIPLLDRKIHSLSNSRYWDHFFSRIILNYGECIPVHVGKDRRDNTRAFNKAKSYLRKGEPVMIFPEGTRSHDGILKKAYNGIGRLAYETKVPVLPMGIIGSHKVFPKGKFPRFRRCDVVFGKPMRFDSIISHRKGKKALEEITRRVMKSIAALIGQEYRY